MSAKYRTVPDQTRRTMPPGIPYIIGNELAERFSFYGMKAILTVFMTQHLLNAAGEPDYMGAEQAKGVYHLFTAAAYFFPLLGAIIADVVLGKYYTILFLSLLYTLGHGALAVMDVAPYAEMDMRPWLYIGLLLIAMGAGAIKPCVSAHVGDQFGEGNRHLISKTFSWFYFSINLGAASSTILTPIFLAKVGPWLAFGVPGVLMAVATFVFWLGRHRFIHVPPAGARRFKEETFSPDGRRALLNLSPLFLLFIPMFWALFDQTGSAWVLQAETMDRKFAGVTWLEAQVQALNPILILILIPTFAYGVYPFMGRYFKVTPLRKIGIGLFMTAAAFTISGLIQLRIEELAPQVAAALYQALETPMPAGATLEEALRLAQREGWTATQIQPYLDPMPNIGWQFLAYVVLTAAEVMVSITSLEFAYTQAPKRMKSFIMGVYFLGVSLGNLFTSGVNFVLSGIAGEGQAGPLDGANYYWFFTILMVLVSLAYVVWSKFYKGRTFIQGEDTPSSCPACGYDLTNLTTAICPECGANVDPAERAQAEAEGPDSR